MIFRENENKFKQKFAKNLRNLRIEKGFTQQQIAKILYVAESTYANWEQGRREPGLFQLTELAFHLNVDINTLFDF